MNRCGVSHFSHPDDIRAFPVDYLYKRPALVSHHTMRVKRRPLPRRPLVYELDPSVRFLLQRDMEDLRRLMVPVVREVLDTVNAAGIHNRQTESCGIGKFCMAPIEKDSLVAIYQGRVCPRSKEAGERTLQLKPIRGRQYVVHGGEPSRINAADINHSCAKANCRLVYVHDDDRRLNAVVCVADRHIAAGEELLVDYAEDFFPPGQGSVPCRCDDPCPKGRFF